MAKFIIKDKLTGFIKKYRYAVLVLLIGVGLMLIPMKTEQKKTETVSLPSENYEQRLSEDLSKILSQIEGAGKVQVLLTISESEKTVFQTNINEAKGETGTSKWDTVIITDADRNQSGMIQQVISPVYQGAIIVCQGAEKASVRLAIVEAVSNITGLGADKISVEKMK